MKRPFVITLLILMTAMPLVLQSGCQTTPKRTADDIAGLYELIPIEQINLENPNTQPMIITALKGKKFIVRGIGWVGQGEVNDQNGYYDWKFDDGKTGRTTIVIDYDTHTFKGHVVGSGLNWRYLARHPK